MRFLNVWLGAALVLGTVFISAPALGHEEYNPRTGADDVSHEHPDCEIDQPAVGSDNYEDPGFLFFHESNSGLDLDTCEGEHWDGQDHAQATGGPNEVHITDLQDEKLVVAVNDGPGDEPPAGATDPLHVRASGKGDNDAFADPSSPGYFDNLQGSLYVHVAVLLVGETNVGADGDGGNGVPGSGNALGFARISWYGEDHTDVIVADNVLARAVSTAGITRGHVADDDCSYQVYEETREERACGRDNTAISVELNV